MSMLAPGRGSSPAIGASPGSKSTLFAVRSTW
jgi:hypothetical protein